MAKAAHLSAQYGVPLCAFLEVLDELGVYSRHGHVQGDGLSMHPSR